MVFLNKKMRYNQKGEYMIYVIYGEQYPLLKKRMKKLVKSLLDDSIDEMNFARYSLRTDLIQDIVKELDYLALGYDKKVVVIEDFYPLSNGKENDKLQDYTSFLKYLQCPSEFNDLILMLETKTINKKSEIYKALEKSARFLYEETLSRDNLLTNGKVFFEKKGANISDEALEELVLRTDGNFQLFMNESEKLTLFSKDISLQDVKNMVSIPLEMNAFNIADYLIKGQKEKALKTYYDLRMIKEEPVRLIALLATQIRFYFQVSYLLGLGHSQNEVAGELGVHPYRVKLCAQNLLRFKRAKIDDTLEKLYQLDCDIKEMKIDPYLAFELFIINF